MIDPPICKRNFFSVSGFFNYSHPVFPKFIRDLCIISCILPNEYLFFFCGFFRCIISIIQIKSYTCFSQQFRCLKDNLSAPEYHHLLSMYNRTDLFSPFHLRAVWFSDSFPSIETFFHTSGNTNSTDSLGSSSSTGDSDAVPVFRNPSTFSSKASSS